LSALTGSGIFEYVYARLWTVPAAATRARTVTVADPPGATESNVQSAVLPSTMPHAGFGPTSTISRPAGSSSRMRTVSAGPGPALVAVMVNVTRSPTVTVGDEADLVIERSARPTRRTALSESLTASGSRASVVTVAALRYSPTAAARTWISMNSGCVMATWSNRQVTTRPATEQLSGTDTISSPSGSSSRTTTLDASRVGP